MPEAAEITPDGFVLNPEVHELNASQGNDPPSSGSGPKRTYLETLYGSESAQRYDSRLSEQLGERIQFRLAQIITVLKNGDDYPLPEDEFAHGFDLEIEIKALHRIVDGQWDDDAIEQAVGQRAWMIRMSALKAYAELHANLVSITLDDQRTALGCLRNWFYLDEASIAGSAVSAYEKLTQHVVELNAADKNLIQDLLSKEQKALQTSIVDHKDDSHGSERDVRALAFIKDLTP